MANVEIVLKMIDQTKAASNSAISSMKNLAGTFTAVSAAAIAVGMVVKDLYNTYQTYAQQVRDLSLVTGQSAEETSRFIQVLDDFQLTAEDATQAARFLKEKGLSPNVETLIQLSREFKAIEDPAQRMAFIQENLGRGGAKWVNILNQEEDALRATAAQINKNLILTDEQIRKAEMQRLAIDELGDSWEGFKVRLGSAIGELILTNQVIQRANDIYVENGGVINANTQRTQEWKDALQQAKTEQEAQMNATIDQKNAGDDLVISLEEQEAAMKELTDANLAYLDLVGELSDRMKDYEQKHADINQQLIDGKINQEEAAIAWQKLADEQEEATNRMMLKMLEQELAADGLTAKETNALLQLGIEWGIYSDSAISSADAARARVNELLLTMSDVPENKTVTIAVNTIYNGSLPSAYLQSEQGRSRGGRTPHASGGLFEIPMSYGNEGFRMGGGDTASGGESMKIIPKGGTGNEDVVAAIYATKINPTDFARVIAEEMMKRER